MFTPIPGMSVSVTRCIVCLLLTVAVPLSLSGQSTPGHSAPGQTAQDQTTSDQTTPAQTPSIQSSTSQAPSAILHTQGGVWINGSEAPDSTAVFTGDLIETKPGFSATLTLAGSNVQLAAESVAKLQENLLVLDHGIVSVVTSASFKVRVNCLTVVPISNERNDYAVTDVNRTIHVAAHKSDVNVDHASNLHKPSPETTTSDGGSVREGQEHNYDETQICGAPAQPTSPGSGLNPKLIEIGAGVGGGGVLLWLLLHGGGGHNPMSPSQP